MPKKSKPIQAAKSSPLWPYGLAALGLIAVLVWWGMDRPPPQIAPAAESSTNTTSAFKTPDQTATFASYAGSESCRSCHAQAYALWMNSHHGLAERPVRADPDQEAFEPAREIKHGSQVSHARVDGDEFQILTAGLDRQTKPFTVERVIGEKPLRQFLIPGERGRYQVTELAFDPALKEWFNVFGGEDRQPGEWGHWTGRGMAWNQMCASCHNTRLRKNYDASTDSYHTAMAEMSVGCESCHGPMKDHVTWQKDRPQPAAGDPTLRRQTRAQMMETCAPCHARRGELTGDYEPGQSFWNHFFLTIPDETDLYYADGQVRDENYEFASFMSSRMFAAGVSCMDCHEPHSARPLAPDNSLCQRCHGPPVAPAPKIDPAAHSFHAPGAPGGRCVDCHMPQTTYMQRHPRRDHGFTIPDPLLTKQHGIPNACNRCHADKDADWALKHVEAWYGDRMHRPNRARAQTVALARQGQTNSIPQLLEITRSDKVPLWRATATRLLERWCTEETVKAGLRERAGDPEPLVRAQAAHALAPLIGLGDAPARSSLEFLLKDPVRVVRAEAAWALRSTLDTNSVAGQDLVHSLSFNADQPTGALQFGVFLMDRGQPGEALNWLRKAVQWDPNSAPLRDSLAVCLSMTGRAEEAARELEAACQLAPNDALFRYRLGLALNETGKLAESTLALEQSVKLDPMLHQAWYNLGLAYSELGRAEEAVQALARAESIEQNSARIPYARATVLARLGQVQEALRAASRALEIEPNHADAAQLLRMLSPQAR